MNEETALLSFLKECKVKKEEPFTHTSKRKGQNDVWRNSSYYIDDKYIDKFMILYCNAIKKGYRPTVTEKPGAYSHLRIDFDLVSPIEKGVHRDYTMSILKEIVSYYQDEIADIISDEVDCDLIMRAIVLEKPSPRVEKGKVKDGFHIHFPFFICDPWIMDDYLRSRVSQKMKDEGIWDNTRYKSDVKNMIDDKMGRKPWMMYGSINYKNEKTVPYLYNNWSKVPKNERYGVSIDSLGDVVSLREIFQEEVDSHDKFSVKYHLPRLLSLHTRTQPTKLIKDIEHKRNTHSKVYKRKRKNVPKRRAIDDILEDLKKIEDGCIMDMLSEERAANYNTWLEVGWILFDIGQGTDYFLELWIEFSRKCPDKFIDGECERLWDRFQLHNKTIASLFMLAKIDSPEEYYSWLMTNVGYLILRSLDEPKPSHYDVSKVIANMYRDRFVCADCKRNVWFEYRDHRWREMDDNIELKFVITENVTNKYAEFRKEINQKNVEIEYRLDMSEKDSDDFFALKADYQKNSEKMKRCSFVISNLKDDSWQRKVINQCKINMKDSYFMKKINENRNLIACENGVIDLELDIFRDGRPDDYITFSTGMYYQEYFPDDEEVIEFDEMLEKIYPNPNLKEYFLDFGGSCLKGGNDSKTFLIATGPSNGGKSAAFKILETALGSGIDGYFAKFPKEIVVQGAKNSSASARPELSRVRGKRIMGVQEVTHGQKIDEGFVKEATGNDSFFARGIYEKGSEIKPQFTMWMQCNELPSFAGHDEAVWIRIKILDHESRFVLPKDLKKYPVPDTIEEQFRIKRFHADRNFDEKIPEYSSVCLWKLFQHYKKCKNLGGVPEPNEVSYSTKRYQEDNDVFQRFIDEILEECPDLEGDDNYISVKECYANFEEWYKANYPSYYKSKEGSIGQKTFKLRMRERLGDAKRNEGYGYNFDGKGKNERFDGWRLYIEDKRINKRKRSFLDDGQGDDDIYH